MLQQALRLQEIIMLIGLSLVYHEYVSELTSVTRLGEKEIFQSL